MKKILLFSAALITLVACNKNTKKNLGLTETLPDEYKVSKNRPLEVPPFYKNSPSAKKETKQSKRNLSKEEEALLKEVE